MRKTCVKCQFSVILLFNLNTAPVRQRGCGVIVSSSKKGAADLTLGWTKVGV